MGPADKKEEWLNSLRESVKDYREPISPDSWQKIERAMSGADTTAVRHRKRFAYRIIGSISAVAAAILIFFIVTPFLSNDVIEKTPPIAVVNNIEELQDNVINEDNTVNNTLQNVVGISVVTKVKKEKGDIIKRDIIDNNTDYNNVNEPTQAIKNESKNESKNENKEEVKEEPGEQTKQTKKELTWEEYLQKADKEEKIEKEKRKSGKWLAFSVGNNGVGAFDPRTKDITNIVREYSAAPTLDINSVKDLALYKRPENFILPTGVANIEPKYKHKQPISFGITFGKNISSKFTVETGLVYSLLSSDIENLQKDKTVRQTLHYLGIPIRFNWNFINKPKYAIYTGAGVLIEKCIYGKSGGERVNIKSVQTSLNLSVGAQYKFNQHVGIYFEPGLGYYLGTKDDGSLGSTSNGTIIKSVHSEHPLGFTLQAGLRFSF